MVGGEKEKMNISKDSQQTKNICVLFQIEEFRSYQLDAICSLIEKKDCFISQPTGSGKSLVFQSYPFFYAAFQESIVETPITYHGLEDKHVSLQIIILFWFRHKMGISWEMTNMTILSLYYT